VTSGIFYDEQSYNADFVLAGFPLLGAPTLRTCAAVSLGHRLREAENCCCHPAIVHPAQAGCADAKRSGCRGKVPARPADCMSYLGGIERKTTALTVLFFSASGAVLPGACAVLPALCAVLPAACAWSLMRRPSVGILTEALQSSSRKPRQSEMREASGSPWAWAGIPRAILC
jgi:hypothetical protein